MAHPIDPNRKKGGRPRKDENERRSRHVKVGFTPLEFDTVEYKARQAGQQNADYIHDAALDARVQPRINDEQLELVRKVAGMGNNLNQIAHKANTAGYPHVSQHLKSLISELSALLRRILRGGDLSE